MAVYSLNTTLEIKPGQSTDVQIHFEYYLPRLHQDWQDPFHGSIKILDICDSKTFVPITNLSIEERIKACRTCWDYLEKNQRFTVNNVVPLF